MITGKHEPLCELDSNPAGRLDRLRALINDEHVKQLVGQLGMNVLSQRFIRSRCQRATNDVGVREHLIDLGRLKLAELLSHLLELREDVELLRFSLSLGELE